MFLSIMEIGFRNNAYKKHIKKHVINKVLFNQYIDQEGGN
jgi:hypothetical protein